MPRLTASSASSRGVQWLTGCPESAGSSHAITTIWTTCSAVKVAGAPERGLSARTLSMSSAKALSSPSASTASRAGAASSQRWRQLCTIPRSLSSRYATCSLLLLTLASSSIFARLTSRWALLRRRTICSRTARCRSVRRIGMGLRPRMRLLIQVQGVSGFDAAHHNYTSYRGATSAGVY